MFVNEEAGQGSCRGGSDTRQTDLISSWPGPEFGPSDVTSPQEVASPSDAGRKEFGRAGSGGK